MGDLDLLIFTGGKRGVYSCSPCLLSTGWKTRILATVMRVARSLCLCLLFFALPCTRAVSQPADRMDRAKQRVLNVLTAPRQPVYLDADTLSAARILPDRPATANAALPVTLSLPGLRPWCWQPDSTRIRNITIASASKKLLFPFHVFW